MAGDSFYKDHWINIDRDRMDRYQHMFQWNQDSFVLYEPARIRSGHIVGDFGSGPGHTAVEFCRWVGRNGHIHALDINSDFIAQTQNNAKAAGLRVACVGWQISTIRSGSSGLSALRFCHHEALTSPAIHASSAG